MALVMGQPRYGVPVSNFHTVQPGQSLQDVAHAYGVDPGTLAAHPRNRHIAGVVHPGVRLFIPKSRPLV
jgi:hypothetical protein